MLLSGIGLAYGPQISENWPRTIRATVPYGPQISENWPRTIRATVPQLALGLTSNLV